MNSKIKVGDYYDARLTRLWQHDVTGDPGAVLCSAVSRNYQVSRVQIKCVFSCDKDDVGRRL